MALVKFFKDLESNPDKAKYKIQLNHKVISLTFGDQIQQKAIKSRFGNIDNGTHTMFNMFHIDGKVNEDLKSFPEDKPQDYFYFIKMVPHIFVDMIEQREWRSYAYSLGHNKKESPTPTFASVTIILDYAPIKMILTKQ